MTDLNPEEFAKYEEDPLDTMIRYEKEQEEKEQKSTLLNQQKSKCALQFFNNLLSSSVLSL